jgi:hypothetical protein
MDRMTTTRQYDFLNRLESISSAPNPAVEPLSLAYHHTCNNASPREIYESGGPLAQVAHAAMRPPNRRSGPCSARV